MTEPRPKRRHSLIIPPKESYFFLIVWGVVSVGAVIGSWEIAQERWPILVGASQAAHLTRVSKFFELIALISLVPNLMGTERIARFQGWLETLDREWMAVDTEVKKDVDWYREHRVFRAIVPTLVFLCGAPYALGMMWSLFADPKSQGPQDGLEWVPFVLLVVVLISMAYIGPHFAMFAALSLGSRVVRWMSELGFERSVGYFALPMQVIAIGMEMLATFVPAG